jgi:hypothetical protein
VIYPETNRFHPWLIAPEALEALVISEEDPDPRDTVEPVLPMATASLRSLKPASEPSAALGSVLRQLVRT